MATTKQSTKKRPATGLATTADADGHRAPTALRVEITRIYTYERNPRRTPNPEYDRIKASIRACGMDQPLCITQRPGMTDYIVQAGGNTRLQAQKELYAATGEARFRWLDCLLVEWQRESEVLLAHLRENDLRGDLSFIDRARAVREVQALVIAELGIEALSDRQLEDVLKERGYHASRSLISVMDYAVSILLPVLPRALEAGLGRPQVQRIRDLQRIGEAVWQSHGAGERSEYHGIFEALARRHDHEDWVFDSLRQALETEIAEATERPIQRLRMEFDCRLAGAEPDIPAFVHDETTDQADFPMARRHEPEVISEAERQALAPRDPTTRGEDDRGAQREPITSSGRNEPVLSQDEIAIERPPGPDIDAILRRVAQATKGHLPLPLLRETAFELARSLAEGHGLGALVEPLPEEGLGYLVCDVPPADVIDPLDPDLRAEVQILWWQLVLFADQLNTPSALLTDRLSENNALAAAVQDQNVARLCPPPEWSQFSQGFCARVGQETWCYWLCLAHNYRELHRTALETASPLWRTPS